MQAEGALNRIYVDRFEAPPENLAGPQSFLGRVLTAGFDGNVGGWIEVVVLPVLRLL